MAGISKLYDGCPNAAKAVKAKRAELLEHRGNVPLDLSEPLTPENRQDLRVNESAAASLLIDFICKHLRQTVPHDFKLPKYVEEPELWWEFFGRLMLEYIHHEEMGLLANIKKRALEKPTEPDEVDKAASRYYAARKVLYPERAQAYKDFPSALDLINFDIPFIRLIEDLYQKTHGKPIPDDQLLHALTQGNIPEIMVQAQINVKSTEFPLADLLVGRISLKDLDDPAMILNSSLGKMPTTIDMAFMKMNHDFFEFEGHNLLHIAIKAEVIELYRAKTKRVFDALAVVMAEAGTPMVRMNCPIIYTEQFRPLWEWFLQNFVRLRFGAEKDNLPPGQVGEGVRASMSTTLDSSNKLGLSPEETSAFLATLESRFSETPVHYKRPEGIDFARVRASLEANPAMMRRLAQMKAFDVVDVRGDEIFFADRSLSSSGRPVFVNQFGSLNYDDGRPHRGMVKVKMI